MCFHGAWICRLCLVLVCSSTTVASSITHHDVSAAGSPPRRYLQLTDVLHNIGNIRPEGIRVVSSDEANELNLGQGEFALVSELMYGGVKAVNLETGAIVQKVPSLEFQDRVGVDVDYANGYILLLGSGFENEGREALRLFASATGELWATCIAENAGFLISVEVVGTIAYMTDAFSNVLWTVDLNQAATEPACNVVGIEMPEESFLPPDLQSFHGGGMVAYGGGLIIATITPGGLYYFDVSSRSTSEILPPGSIVDGYGMAIANDPDGTKLYIVNNIAYEIMVYTLSEGVSSSAPFASFLGTIKNADFDQPLRASVRGARIWAANTRLTATGFPAEGEDDLSTFGETFDLIGVDRSNMELGPTSSPTRAPTDFPTVAPTDSPVAAPTDSPVAAPTDSPTKAPTSFPTLAPTSSPTIGPVPSPTQAPVKTPITTLPPLDSPAPTPLATSPPSRGPTTSPIVTSSPAESPIVTPVPTAHSPNNGTETPIESPEDTLTTSPKPSVETLPPTTSPVVESTTEQPVEQPIVPSTESPVEPPTPSSGRSFLASSIFWSAFTAGLSAFLILR